MKQASLKLTALFLFLILCSITIWHGAPASAQMTDRTQNPNVANVGIAKSLAQEIGAGEGDWTTPDSSSFIIARDPFRAIHRSRQLIQRKLLRSQRAVSVAND